MATDQWNDSRGVSAGRLACLEDVLWEWIAVQERSARLWAQKDEEEKDVLWWYGERTSLGAFAGAIWRSGGMVLEEYSTLKKKLTGAQGRKEANGRGDMDFALGGTKYTLEAKQCWPELGSDDSTGCIKEYMNRAASDVARVRSYPGYAQLAAVFASPRSTPNCGSAELHRQVREWIKKTCAVRGDLKGCACAWIFPQNGMHLRWERNKRYYPGAALFIKHTGGSLPH